MSIPSSIKMSYVKAKDLAAEAIMDNRLINAMTNNRQSLTEADQHRIFKAWLFKDENCEYLKSGGETYRIVDYIEGIDCPIIAQGMHRIQFRWPFKS